MSKSKVVILGAGVSGLRTAQKLKKTLKPGEAELLLVDQNDYHQLLYRLHKVCNYEYIEKDIIIPLEKLINDIPFKKAKVKAVDIESKAVKTDEGDLSYDLLLIAMGSHPTYFGINGIQENSVTLGSYEEAKEIREKIFKLYENVEKNDPPNFVIGGAGFTGIELAGEIIESIPKLCKEFGVKEPETKLTIVEALPTILPGWDEKLIENGSKYLEEQGVNLHLSDPVVNVGENSVELKSGTVLKPDLFIWTGGVEGDPACGKGFEIKSRRIVVDEYLQHNGVEDVFIAGDQACAVDSNGKPMPPNAHIAMMQADIAAHNILAKLRGEAMKKYKFEHAGEIVTFGKGYAVGEIFGYNLYGLLAKIMKQFIHVWYLHSIGGINLIFEYW